MTKSHSSNKRYFHYHYRSKGKNCSNINYPNDLHLILNILVIAAHPDDEVLGMGATIKKLTKKKHNVHLCVVSEGATAQYTDDKMIQVRKNACKKAGKLLGISNFYFLEFPDMLLDSIPQLEINKKLEKIIKKFKPDIVYTTSSNDLNKDHQIVHDSTLVVTRPYLSKIRQVLAYEVPGQVKTPFLPNIFEEISKELKFKINAFNLYKTEVMKFPHPRSVEAIRNLAIQRGIESGFKNSEAFSLIRYNII